MEQDFLEIYAVIQGIVGFIAIIVFFVMADNIGRIRRMLTPQKQKMKDLNYSINREIFKGNNEKAIDQLHEKAFYLAESPSDEAPGEEKRRLKKLSEVATKITELGGTVSKPLADYLEKNHVEN